MDYLQGVLHVIHGNMKQVSKTTFVATPNNVGIDSENGAE
jgi:FtsZ-interacting cell division protein YlmF